MNYITYQGPSWTPSATTNWVRGVSNTGTFKTKYNLPKIFDNDHIPPNWDIWEYDAPMTFRSIGDTTIKLTMNSSIWHGATPSSVQYNKNKEGWQDYTFGNTISLTDKD